VKQKYSVLIRTACGVLGILGVGAIGLSAVHDGGIQPTFILFVKLFAGFVFLYVAIFGASPLDIRAHDDHDNGQ
jgi:hypothetical protein